MLLREVLLLLVVRAGCLLLFNKLDLILFKAADGGRGDLNNLSLLSHHHQSVYHIVVVIGIP